MTAPGLHRLIAPISTGGITGKAIPYSPVWSSLGNGIVPSNGGAGAVVGSYALVANLVYFEVKITLTNVTDFGTGQYTLTVPFAPTQNQAFRTAGLHEGSNHYPLMLDVVGGTTTGKFYYIGANGQDLPMTKNSPHVLTTSDFFYVSGLYLRQV